MELVSRSLTDNPQVGRTIVIGMGTGFFSIMFSTECFMRNKTVHYIDHEWKRDPRTVRLLERYGHIIRSGDPTDFMMRNELIETYFAKIPYIVLNKFQAEMSEIFIEAIKSGRMRSGSVIAVLGGSPAFKGSFLFEQYKKEYWNSYDIYIVK